MNYNSKLKNHYSLTFKDDVSTSEIESIGLGTEYTAEEVVVSFDLNGETITMGYIPQQSLSWTDLNKELDVNITRALRGEKSAVKGFINPENEETINKVKSTKKIKNIKLTDKSKPTKLDKEKIKGRVSKFAKIETVQNGEFQIDDDKQDTTKVNLVERRKGAVCSDRNNVNPESVI